MACCRAILNQSQINFIGFDLWQRAHGLMLPGKDGQKENLLVRPMSSRDLAILLISGKMTIL